MQNFDDLDIEGRMPSHVSEEEREKEDHERKRLMRSSVTAEDGILRPVYSETEDGDIWCHICNIALYGAHKLLSHNTCNRHKLKLDDWPYPVLLWSKRSDIIKKSKSQPATSNDSLAPGEPAPPGMEDQVKRSTAIQMSLDRHRSSPLVGLEYLFELIDNDSCEPSYTCVLCDKRGDPRTVMAHITSWNHRITYLNRHFPTVSRAISELPRTPNYKRGANEISILVAKKIEEHFGRLYPQLVDKNLFEKNKMQYIKQVCQDFHFRETPELTFMDVYDVRWVTNFEEKMAEITASSKKEKGSADDIKEDTKKDSKSDNFSPKRSERSERSVTKTDSGKTLKIRILTKDKINQQKLDKDKDKKSPVKDADDLKSLSSLSSMSSSPSPTRHSRNRSRSRSRSTSSRHRKTSPYERTRRYRVRHSRERSRSLDPLRERDKWDKYKEQIRRAEETLDRALKFHEKNPEKHPAYPDEWKKFWNRRYKELQSEGKDPSKHDFKPEWIEFWNKRMRELHNEQIQQRKDEIRKRLELTDEKPPEKYSKSRRSRTPTSEKRKHRNESDDDVEYVGTKTIKQYHDRHEFRESREREREYSSSYHYSRSSRPPPPSYSSYYRPPARPRYHATPYPVKDNKSPSPVADELPEDLEVVGLLRLLTALEDQLGSLGPKIVSLLSKALAAEKLKPNSAEELLYDEEVSVLFETVKEKLKGQLFAGMIEKMAIPPTKSAIQNIARLLHKAAESKKKHEEEKKKKQDELMEMSQSLRMFMGLNRPAYARTVEVAPKSEPVSVPGVGTVDKVAIAQQISVALIAQGRTDVTQEELETLINAVVGMAAASKNSEKPVTTADFVKGLTSSDTPAAIEPKEPSPPPVKPTPPPAPQVKPTPETIETKAARMETLSDNELQSLLQNFKELNTEDQHALITFLKKLEATDPPRVEKLRAYVNLGPPSSSKARSPSPEAARSTKSSSPFSSRKGNVNPPEEDDKWKAKYNMFADDDEESEKADEKKKMELSDDDDDDYSFEDIYKAADKNVSENEKKKKHSTSRSRSKSWSRSRSRSPLSHKSGETRNSDSNAILSETKRQIENIMRDLPTKFASKVHERIEPVVQPVQAPLVRPNVPVTVSTNYNQNYNPRGATPTQQQALPPTAAQAPHCAVYPNHSNQYPGYPVQQQPQQVQQPNIFNNTYHNGYGAYNQGYANMPTNQTQYSMQNQFPQQTFNDPYNGPANSAYHPNQAYGNYPQQSRFY